MFSGTLWLIAVVAVQPTTPLLDSMATELDRSLSVLSERDQPVHFCAVSVTDETETEIMATAGTVACSRQVRDRYLDVDLRVGTPTLDSTHPLRGTSSWRQRSRNTVRIPLEDTPEHPLRHAIWHEIDARYREASQAMVMLEANQAVRVEEEDPAPDFEPREPISDQVAVAPMSLDVERWEAVLSAISARLDASPRVHTSTAGLRAETRVVDYVDSEGSRLRHGGHHLRLSLTVSATADDGDVIRLGRYLDAHDPASLPTREMIEPWADELVERLEAQLDAPRGQPYSGPVLLHGRAAGVFFHEVMGHRLEGHRQKREREGKTFKEYVGRPILPSFIDVVDDPTLPSWDGTDLNGYYHYDDEGVPAERTVLVEDGILRGFLMGRSPIEGFEHSNGHGRRSTGRPPLSRMGNTIIEAEQGLPPDRLRELLLEEVRRQGLEYGIVVEEIDGGFTSTGRVWVNSFNVRARTCWRVYADGRPDELVRGIDLIGTPLEAFGNVIAAGDDAEVFNGWCGAESGAVPVASVSPSILLSSLEFQLKEKGSDRPPLLPKPADASVEVIP